MAQNYPADEFDDIEPSGRRGAHRKASGGMSQGAAIALVIVLALIALLLVVGAVRIIGSSTVDAEQQVAEETAAPEGDETTAASDVEKTAEVTVLNASGVSGAAARFSDALEAEGWTIADSSNAKSALTETVVYYSDPELEAQAQAVADFIGGSAIEESAEYDGEITVLLCSDLADTPPGSDSATDPVSDAAGSQAAGSAGSTPQD